jgi:hypothetical protein
MVFFATLPPNRIANRGIIGKPWGATEWCNRPIRARLPILNLQGRALWEVGGVLVPPGNS